MVLGAAAQAWGCASLALVEIDPKVVQPGQEVAVKVTFVNKDKPVELRWNALNGPLLATIEPGTFTEGLHGNWRFASGAITIPANATSGNYLLIANQEAVQGTNTWGIPARTLVQVSSAGSPVVGQPVGPAPEVRPESLVAEQSVGGGEPLLVGLGAAGISMLLAGLGIVVLASRRDRAEAVPAAAEPAR
ncbi:MAG TPA: hypothetical protein VM263_10285 [Acidimicrobiales bacterium]|nr:hypothetical protein [Acidimicrobiales bacterium]